MKNKALVVGIMVASTVVATTAMGGIKNSKHDLSRDSTGASFKAAADNTQQICVFCHTPHSANTGAGGTYYPLWNRSNISAAGFTLYSSINMHNPKNATGFTTDSVSLYCMSCHDGGALGGNRIHNNPIDALSGITMVTGKEALPNTGNKAYLGTNLSSTHPINFPVIKSGASYDLGTAGTASIKTSSITNALPLFKATHSAANTSPYNADGNLECASCHKVHDPTISPFLRTTMKGSLLCLGCHVK